MDAGLLLARLTLGLLMAAHGSQKLFGWLGGPGLVKAAGFFDAMGFRPGRLFATTAALTEFASGLLLAVGLFEPIAAALMVSVMVVAMSVHWSNGLLVTSNGVEVPLLYGLLGVSLALTGPGAFSLDSLLGLTPLWTPLLTWGVLAIGIAGGLANLALKRPLPRPVTA
jgi:putative oxidoreductase